MAKKPRGDSRERLDKVPVTVYLDKKQAAALEEISTRTDVAIPKSALLRKAVDLLIDHYSPENSIFKRYIEQRRRK